MSPRDIVDAHVHLDPMAGPDAETAVNALRAEISGASISSAFLLHLESQPWSLEEVAKAVREHEQFVTFANIDPMSRDSVGKLRYAVEELGYRGLKLHPRLHEFPPDVQEAITLGRFAGSLYVPIVIDAFPDGNWIRRGWEMSQVAALAESCPETVIIAAHFGGHRCIDLMMMAKTIPNLFVDVSFTFMYYTGSSVVQDLMYCCRSMAFRKVLYGSDTPEKGIEESLREMRSLLDQFDVDAEDQRKLMGTNAISLIGRSR